MTQNFDYLLESKNISLFLYEQGLKDEAKTISDVLSYGSTGTEICMGIYYNLGKIVENGYINSIVRERVLKLQAEIGKLL
jgi:hypothetical protein